MYQNNEIEMVKASQLDTLISSTKIKKFLRSEGWVTVGVDPTRKERKVNYKGSEKRQAANGKKIPTIFKRVI
jgi:hypothetical protein